MTPGIQSLGAPGPQPRAPSCCGPTGVGSTGCCGGPSATTATTAQSTAASAAGADAGFADLLQAAQQAQVQKAQVQKAQAQGQRQATQLQQFQQLQRLVPTGSPGSAASIGSIGSIGSSPVGTVGPSNSGAGGGVVPADRTKSRVYGGTDKLAAPTRALVSEIDSRFGPFPAIGGWRSDGGIKGGGEHPLGKAADFMLSTAGKLPGPDRRAKGDQIAEWAKTNAERLGIKYIIWNQRIWNPDRASEGWRPMEDRGSITQNHKDHIHISMK